MWKGIFIGITVILIYFSYGVASHGGVWAFFIGAAVGAVVTYLFTRARQEAAANHNTNLQSVNVNVSQNKASLNGSGFTDSQVMAIAEIVSSINEHKQLLSKQIAPPSIVEIDDMSESERLAYFLRERRSNHA